MSNKKIIEYICSAISNSSHIVTRDLVELSKLQSASTASIERFAFSSYKKYTLSLASKVSEIIPAYSVSIPEKIYAQYGKKNVEIKTSSIVDLSEYQKKENDIGSFFINPIDNMIGFSRSFSNNSTTVCIFIDKENGDKEMAQSVVFDIANSHWYTFTSGNGFYQDNIKCSMSQRAKISEASLACVNMELGILKNSKNNDFLKTAAHIRNLGLQSGLTVYNISSFMAYSYLLSGKVDIVVDFDPCPQSQNYALALANESGAKCFDVKGEAVNLKNSEEKKIFAMTNKDIAQSFLDSFINKGQGAKL